MQVHGGNSYRHETVTQKSESIAKIEIDYDQPGAGPVWKQLMQGHGSNSYRHQSVNVMFPKFKLKLIINSPADSIRLAGGALAEQTSQSATESDRTTGNIGQKDPRKRTE